MSAVDKIRKQILNDVRKAVNVISEKALADMYEETADYYTGGEPVSAEQGGYVRTGALGDTPKTTALTVGDKEVSFDAYLDTNYRYTSGKRPTMTDVLNLADKGQNSSSVGYLRATVGKRNFWERAQEKIEKDMDNTMRSFFK